MKPSANHTADSPPSPALRQLADRLGGLAGLGEIILLRLDMRNSHLVACAPEGGVAPSLSIRLEGGHCAACRALLARAPTLALREDRHCDPLDQRLAGEMDGVLAVPMASEGGLEVLLVSGRRAVLETLRDLPGDLPSPPARPPASAPSAKLRRAVEEISDPVGVIKNYLTVLEQRGNAAEELAVIRSELDRIIGVARALACEETPIRGELLEETDLGRLIDDLSRVGYGAGDAGAAHIRHHGLPDAPHPRLDRDKVKELLLLLLPVLLKAAPEGGEVRLESGRVTRRGARDFVELRALLPHPGDAERASLTPEHARISILAQDMGGEFLFDKSESDVLFRVLFPL